MRTGALLQGITFDGLVFMMDGANGVEPFSVAFVDREAKKGREGARTLYKTDSGYVVRGWNEAEPPGRLIGYIAGIMHLDYCGDFMSMAQAYR